MRLLARDASVLLKALEQLGNGTNTPAMISVDRPPEGPAISKLERGLEFSLLSLHFPKHLLLEPLDGKQSFGDRVEGEASGGAAQVVVDEATFVLPLEGVIDLAAERARLTKAIEAASKERDSLAGRLNNPSFVERAKPEAVEKARADHAEKSAEAERLTAALARLG